MKINLLVALLTLSQLGIPAMSASARPHKPRNPIVHMDAQGCTHTIFPDIQVAYKRCPMIVRTRYIATSESTNIIKGKAFVSSEGDLVLPKEIEKEDNSELGEQESPDISDGTSNIL